MQKLQKSLLLISQMLVLVAISCSRHNENEYHVIRNESFSNLTEDREIKLASTIQFLTGLINSYRSNIVNSVQPDFYDRFDFMNTNVSARVIFSTSSECLLNFHPSRSNSLTADCTDYPVQASLFAGLGTTNDEAGKLTVLKTEFLSLYENESNLSLFNLGPIFYLKATNIFFGSAFPKVFRIGGTNIIMTHGFRFKLYANPLDTNSLLRTFNMPDYSIFTGGKDFRWAIPDTAEILGQLLSQDVMKELFLNSDSFRAALAEPKLKEIAEKISMAEEQRKVGKDYPFWKFLRDKDKLVDVAKKAGLTEAYADDFFKDFETNRLSGALFWTYHSNKNFMWQWFYAGLIFLVLSQLTIRLKSKPLRNWSMGIILIAIVCVTGFAFNRMPNTLTFEYWILPGVVFLFAGLPLSWKLYKEASKKRSR